MNQINYLQEKGANGLVDDSCVPISIDYIAGGMVLATKQLDGPRVTITVWRPKTINLSEDQIVFNFPDSYKLWVVPQHDNPLLQPNRRRSRQKGCQNR